MFRFECLYGLSTHYYFRMRRRLKDRKLDERQEGNFSLLILLRSLEEKKRDELFRISDKLKFQAHRQNRQRDNLRSQAIKVSSLVV